ncbi:TIGR00730 family Rossman fold protein [Reichenbachiella sp. MALMAid0571]|uniref:LOG family protein n=1 Tax=Reichenbachiella sp. MALMAid0571 TaxID=3143939 RepID=UPI0032DF722C
MKTICVFCGSSIGKDPEFEIQATQLGAKLAAFGIALVYGGSKIGLMGAVAKGCADNGGKVIGVIPHFLDQVEITNLDADELYQTKSMHERKMKMSQLSEGFIALPGGFGTMDELCEILTWAQLGLVKHPIGLLNINGYFDHLIALFRHMNTNQLLKDQDLKLLLYDDNIDGLLQKMKDFTPEKNSFLDKLDLL